MNPATESRPIGPAARGTLAAGNCSERLLVTVIMLLIAFGAVLRLAEFHRNYSLNHDEACLALNIIQRPFSQLARPLDYLQASPFGFLAIEHFAVKVLGASEKALRLFPLMCSLVSLPLFWMLARRKLQIWPQLFAVGFFAVSQNLVVMSAWVKQYSTELLVAIAVFLVCEPLLRVAPTKRQLVNSAILGAIALWFSYSACFVLGGIGLACLLAFGPGKSLQRYVFVFSAWAISFVPIFLSAGDSRVKNTMQAVWAPNFLPWSSPQLLVPWLWNGFKSLCDSATSYRLAPIAVVFLVIGMIVVWKRRNYSGVALVFSLLLCLLASALGQYPFTSRFLFYLAPAVLLLIFETFRFIGDHVNASAKRVFVSVLTLLLAYASLSAVKNRVLRDAGADAREALAEIRKQWRPGDKIYLSGAGTPLFFYYEHSLGFPANVWVTGRDAKSQEMDPVFSPIPVSEGRGWFIYFRGEDGFDERVVKLSGRSGARVGKFDYDTYSVALWKLGGF